MVGKVFSKALEFLKEKLRKKWRTGSKCFNRAGTVNCVTHSCKGLCSESRSSQSPSTLLYTIQALACVTDELSSALESLQNCEGIAGLAGVKHLTIGSVMDVRHCKSWSLLSAISIIAESSESSTLAVKYSER